MKRRKTYRRKRRVVKTMAKRRTRTIYRRARRSYRRSRGFAGKLGGGTLGPVIQGAVAGLAASTLNGRVPYGSTLGVAGVGWFMKNPTLLTLAGMQLASLIPNPLAGTTNTSSTGGGFI
jgi:hypothetical protein